MFFTLGYLLIFLFIDVYIVVQKFDDEYYEVGVTIKDGVRNFGPSFPFPPYVHKDLLKDFLLTKSKSYEYFLLLFIY